VSDLGLPGEDGLSLIRKVRQAGTLVPAIALTAFARSNDRARALEAGFDAHMAKPVEPDDLVSMAVNLVRTASARAIAPR
jgi:CheY-like chemotaxis protein